ncbi:hypothetical protein ACXR2U_10890 [Jatrophihabitans sp. YIM 134969]
MRRILVPLTVLALPAAVLVAAGSASAAGADTLTSGASLSNNQQISAANHYRLTMGSDGNAVVRNPSGAAVWVSGTQGHPGAKLTMQTDGNLVIRATNGVAIWVNNRRASTPHLTIQSDGNLVERSGSGVAVWATGVPKPKPPAQPGPSGATLPSNGRMTSNQALRTTNGYTFTVQSDGNLVLRAGTRAYRTFGGPGHPNPSLVLQTDGNLVARTAAGAAYWVTNTAGRGAVRLVLGNDGNLVLYTASGVAVWQSGKDAGATPPPPPGVQYGIIPGAYCTPPNAVGYSKAGNRYVCSYYSTDGRYHWKRA